MNILQRIERREWPFKIKACAKYENDGITYSDGRCYPGVRAHCEWMILASSIEE